MNSPVISEPTTYVVHMRDGTRTTFSTADAILLNSDIAFVTEEHLADHSLVAVYNVELDLSHHENVFSFVPIINGEINVDEPQIVKYDSIRTFILELCNFPVLHSGETYQLDYDTTLITHIEHYDTIEIPVYDSGHRILDENVFNLLRDQQLARRKLGDEKSFFWHLCSGDAIVINCKHESKIAPTYKLKVIHSRRI